MAGKNKKSNAQVGRRAKSNRITAGSVSQKPLTRRQSRETAKKLLDRAAILKEWKSEELPVSKPPATTRPLQVKAKYLRSKSQPKKKSQQASEISHLGKKKLWARRYQAAMVEGEENRTDVVVRNPEAPDLQKAESIEEN